jgi:hypothetical protein
MNEDLDYRLYVLAELAYEKEHEGKSEEELFPNDWYSITNYKTKIEIIEEAIKNNILIQDTQKYQDRIEGIKLTNIKE